MWKKITTDTASASGTSRGLLERLILVSVWTIRSAESHDYFPWALQLLVRSPLCFQPGKQNIVDNNGGATATSASHLINNGLLTFLSGGVVGGGTFVEAVEAVNGELDVSALASDFEYDTDMDEDCSEGA